MLKNRRWPVVDWRILVAVAVAWRIVLVFVFSSSVAELQPDRIIAPGFGMIADDYGYFINPAEKFYQEGNYSYRHDLPFAGRMPGYAVFYLLFRLFLSQEGANLMMIVAQAILGGLGVYALARTAEIFYKSEGAFWITFALGMLYPVSAFFDYQTITEGLAISSLSFSLYFLVRGMEKRHAGLLVLSGLFLTWSFFLRPFMGVLVPLVTLYVLWSYPGRLPVRLSRAVVFLLPFMVLMGTWNIRNYHQFGKVVLMQTSGEESYGKIYSKSWAKVRGLIVLWGGETAYFEPNSEAYWFRIDRGDDPLNAPAHIYAYNCFTESDLKELKLEYQQFHYSEGFDTTQNLRVAALAEQYIECFKERRSTTDKFRHIWRFVGNAVFRSGSSYMLPLSNTMLDRVMRLLFFGGYYFILLIAFSSVFVRPKTWIFLCAPVLMLLSLLYISSIVEHRYFLTALPFIVLAASGGILEVTQRFNRKKAR